jgi:hypothetical protein
MKFTLDLLALGIPDLLECSPVWVWDTGASARGVWSGTHDLSELQGLKLEGTIKGLGRACLSWPQGPHLIYSCWSYWQRKAAASS